MKAISKEEKFFIVVTEEFMEDAQSLWIVNLEDSQDKEQLLTVVVENVGSEECVEFLIEIPDDMESLLHELIVLERRLENQRVHIQNVI